MAIRSRSAVLCFEPEQLDNELEDVKDDADCDFIGFDCVFADEIRDDISILGPAASMTSGFSW